MELASEIREYYTHPAKMTAPGMHPRALDGLPHDLKDLCDVVQGVLLHEHWAAANKVTLTPARRAESQIRSASHMISQILSHDVRPIAQPRDLSKRVVGVCRHFTVLAAALLRHQGVPARARCGFGSYFNRGTFEDHWVVEYWNETQNRWVLADAQIDALQTEVLRPDFTPLDVPRDRFIIAGDAWQQCREDEADPATFGIFDMRGMWFIAGNVLRDFAALNNMEMLPWDVWGAMSATEKPLSSETVELVDHAARLTLDSDAHFSELRTVYGNDERVRVPPMVFNALNKRLEDV